MVAVGYITAKAFCAIMVECIYNIHTSILYIKVTVILPLIFRELERRQGRRGDARSAKSENAGNNWKRRDGEEGKKKGGNKELKSRKKKEKEKKKRKKKKRMKGKRRKRNQIPHRLK